LASTVLVDNHLLKWQQLEIGISLEKSGNETYSTLDSGAQRSPLMLFS